jgi:5,10-methylenetetrahydrofolate reductase
MSSGVSYFISQCVFNVDYAKRVIDDLTKTCTERNIELPTIIFTLTACGSIKTLHFMEWLGIHIPEELKAEFRASENILEKSVDVCLTIAEELINYCSAKAVPFGFNIESVAIRKDEIEASIFMTNKIGEMLKERGIRK